MRLDDDTAGFHLLDHDLDGTMCWPTEQVVQCVRVTLGGIKVVDLEGDQG